MFCLFRKKVQRHKKELSDELKELPQVTSILSYVDTVGAEIPESYLDSDTLSQLNSDNYTRMVISVEADYEGEETFDLVKKIRDIAEKILRRKLVSRR